MLTFRIYVKTAWNDYFTVTNPKNYNSQTYTSTQTLSDTNVYISNCLFKSITSGSSGGALSCTSVTNLLIESTSFFSCSTSAIYGGAIYFSNENSGQSVLHSVCGYDCCSTYSSGYSDGQFARIDVKDGILSKNYVNYSSITRCDNQKSSSQHMLFLSKGKICCPSINMSLNINTYIPGVSCYPYCDSNSVTCSLTYSSFADDNATISICIWLWTTGANYEIKSCNIIRHTQGTLNSYGTIAAYGNLMIQNSCILENKATYIFYQHVSSYTTTLSNCTVDSTSNNRNLNIQSTVTKSFIHALNHMSTRNCHSGYDSIGTLTPITPLPSSKKQIHCYTCGNCFHQSHLRIFFSLLSVFIFNFIYLDSSIYPLY
jgi:hypothetical protein